MKKFIYSKVAEGVRAVERLLDEDALTFIQSVALEIAECLNRKNKILIAGNGGSLADAMHFAEELTGQFRSKRRALPALALADPAHITCTGNDMGFERIFARGIEAFGCEGDIFIGLTTSGNSSNIVAAFQEAKERGLKTIAFLGKDGGLCKGIADLELIIQGFKTSDRIQEAHMTAMHIIIDAVEHLLFERAAFDLLATV